MVCRLLGRYSPNPTQPKAEPAISSPIRGRPSSVSDLFVQIVFFVGLVWFFKVGNGLRLCDLGSSQGPTHSPSHSLLCVWSLVRCRLNDLGSSQGPTDSQSPNHCGVKIGDADLGPSWGPTCTPILIMLLVGADCMTWVPAKGPPYSLSFLL